MCGIAGVVGGHGIQSMDGAVLRMARALARRGPDAEGLEIWTHAVLGHRRLAIFDLSEAGHQPMVLPDRRVGIVFNGAIYNFRELRALLESRGCEFHSHTDTEVLLHGYREWGIDDLVRRLHGMFAFGLWDDDKRKLFLVRDRLGVKPLVYAERNGQLAFASTVRALRSGGFTGDIDENSVAEYLEFGFVTDARSIYRGVSKVPAATILEWSADGSSASRQYWSPPRAAGTNRQTFEDAVDQTEKLLLRAVERRLYADVPVGALLSGGVDSSLICWAIARLGGNVTAYTVAIPNDPWDESADARATAGRLGISHHVLELSPDAAPDFSELASAYAEPFACASALGMLMVSRAVAPAAKVLLTGDGGDDVFLGYPEHRHYWVAQKLGRAVPAAAANRWQQRRRSMSFNGPFRRATSFIDYTTGGLGSVISHHDGWPVYQKHNLLGARLAGATISQRLVSPSIDSARHLMNDFLEYDRATRFTGEYLPKVDGATMYYALEARSPFLDQEIWEFAAALPYDLRLHRGRLKAVLRELARRKVGERVARGRKRGFGVPVQRWIAGRWRRIVEETLRNSLLEREGWIRIDAALSLLEHDARSGWAPIQLWYILVLESWLQDQRYAERAYKAAHS